MHNDSDTQFMQRACELASQGEGAVEPNPMVGCVIVRQGEIVGEGWHQRFGGPHAEVHAIESAASASHGATMYVSLEPCCHHGKTPPCTEAIIGAKLRRVVIGAADPFEQVAGVGVQKLREASITVDVGCCEHLAMSVIAPYLKLTRRKRPWMIAKWAMTLDGRIASHTGSSQWISNEASRALTHQLRGRVDGILIGSGTAAADDPLLTARPAGVRTPMRIVVDSQASLSLGSQLVQTARQTPVLIAVAANASAEKQSALQDAGCKVLVCNATNHQQRLKQLLDELGRRRMTNVLVEGGAGLLGSLLDAGEIDEVHAFIAPKLIGGQHSLSPIAGKGIREMSNALQLCDISMQQLGTNVYFYGRIPREHACGHR